MKEAYFWTARVNLSENYIIRILSSRSIDWYIYGSNWRGWGVVDGPEGNYENTSGLLSSSPPNWHSFLQIRCNRGPMCTTTVQCHMGMGVGHRVCEGKGPTHQARFQDSDDDRCPWASAAQYLPHYSAALFQCG
eukprot:scaffold30866_cov19-Tisochrysis_lutea.AAC.1